MSLTCYFPEIEGPQSRVVPGRRRILCKGGGGGSSAPYYANMDRLYGAQARAAEYMLDQSMPVLPEYMSNSNRMVTDAMDGTLARQMRQLAGDNVQASFGTALDANSRNMSRYGMQFDSNRLLSEGNRNAILGAAHKAGALNSATVAAEDMKWNRNAGALGQATGMGTGAMQTMGQAAGGYGMAAANLAAGDRANAAGYGQFGGALAANAFAEGGEVIEGEWTRVDETGYGLHSVRLAAGGDPWTAWKSKNPITMGGMQEGEAPSALTSVLAGAAPVVAGQGLKAAMGSNVVKDVGAKLYGAARSGIESAIGYNPTQAAAEVIDKSTMLAEAGPTGAAPLADAGAAAATDAAGTAAATTGAEAATAATTGAEAATAAATGAEAATAAAGAEAAAGAAGAAGAGAGGALATVGAAAPWLLGLYGVGAMFDWWADGGAVPKEGAARADYRPGGAVRGPGTETSDDIPAWLSKGEVVENATATKLAGKDTLLAINDAGLRVRRGEQTAAEGRAEIGQIMIERGQELAGAQAPGLRLADGGCVGKSYGLKFGDGGFLGGNLGIALGAGVQEFKSQRQAAREAEQFDWAKQDRQREETDRVNVGAFWHEIGPMFGADPKTKAEYLQDQYRKNRKIAGYDDGYDVEIEHLPDNTIAYKTKLPDGKGGFADGERRVVTPQDIDAELLRFAHAGLASINPRYGANFMAHLQQTSIEGRKAAQKDRELDIEGKKVDATAKHYQDWADINRGKLTGAADGAGSAKAASADATSMPPEIGAVYGHYGYKDPSTFTENIRKRVAADSANAGLNANVDMQELATKTQQYTAALMAGQIGAGYTVEELYPVALRMAQSEMGVKPAATKLGADGKPVPGTPGAYLPHADLGKDGRWYSYVLDGNGTRLTLGARPVDPTRFGLTPEKVADAEIKHPNIRAAVKEAYDLSTKNDESGIAEMVRRIGEEKAIALLNAYSRTLPGAAQPAAAGSSPSQPATAAPARQAATSRPSDADVATMIADAKRGGTTGKEWLRKHANDFSVQQLSKIEQGLNIGSVWEL